jgi:hypothetical protein
MRSSAPKVKPFENMVGGGGLMILLFCYDDEDVGCNI